MHLLAVPKFGGDVGQRFAPCFFVIESAILARQPLNRFKRIGIFNQTLNAFGLQRQSSFKRTVAALSPQAFNVNPIGLPVIKNR